MRLQTYLMLGSSHLLRIATVLHMLIATHVLRGHVWLGRVDCRAASAAIVGRAGAHLLLRHLLVRQAWHSLVGVLSKAGGGRLLRIVRRLWCEATTTATVWWRKVSIHAAHVALHGLR